MSLESILLEEIAVTVKNIARYNTKYLQCTRITLQSILWSLLMHKSWNIRVVVQQERPITMFVAACLYLTITNIQNLKLRLGLVITQQTLTQMYV